MFAHDLVRAGKFAVKPVAAERWIRDGWRMAQREREGVFGSIEKKHTAELAAFRRVAQGLKARGHIALARRTELESSLKNVGFDAAQHLKELANGKVDLVWAVALSILNATLIVFVLLAFGPSWLAVVLSLMVVASTVAVEEFFQAYDEKAVVREAIFLTLSVLALAAQFWLGTLRGMFLAAVTSEAEGPVTEMFREAAPILQYSFGLLALVTECLCGYKWYRVRAQLNSASARAVRKRDQLNNELTGLHATVQGTEREPDVRRAYREIGARQFLAAEAQAAAQAGRDHFKRAAIGAAIALVILAIISLFLLPSPVAAQQLSGQIVILLDRTKSITTDSFQQNVEAIKPILKTAPIGCRVVVVGITDSFARPEILLDHRLPPRIGYLGLDLQVARERLAFKWQQVAKTLTPIYGRSDVLGSLALLQHLGASGAETTLIVFSDLRQSSKQFDIENVPTIPVDQALERLKKWKAIPVLPQTRVFLLGVDPTGKSAAYFAALKDFWLRFFAEAGATVEVFSITRQMPPFTRSTR